MRGRRRGITGGRGLVLGLAALILAAGCGGGPATSTPLPAVVRPEQPTPAYAESTAFRLATPAETPPLVALPQAPPDLAAIPVETPLAPILPADHSLLQQPATALGIVRSGAALLDAPGGALLQRLPAGATVILTGKSSDGAWLAAYSANGESGWVAARSLHLFGDETLTVVTTAEGPGAIATLLATALAPMPMPTTVLTETVGR